MTNGKPIERPSFLFIPVSSPEGIGEYMRSLIIAKQLTKNWPEASINFILSQQAPYVADCPFPVLLTPSSPTKHVKLVNSFIKKLLPNIVIFDASGRNSQFQQAKKLGAKVVFISQHHKKRTRGLRLKRIPLIDCHWVAQPEFLLPDLSQWENLKLTWFNKRPPKYTGCIFSPVNKQKQQKLLTKLNIENTDFIIFNAGSGGHKIANTLAADIYAEAAEHISKSQNVTCVMLYGSNYPYNVASTGNVVAIKQLDNSDFINLIDAAQAVVISGGDTLLQTIALQKPCLTTPVSKDQPNRINHCVSKNLVLTCPTTTNDMIKSIETLLKKSTQQQLINNLKQSKQSNGLDIVMHDFTSLVNMSNQENLT